jgi:hypothetical protein
MKRLAARAPGLDIFNSGYVLRADSGWQITDAGRDFLMSIEAPAPAEPASEPVVSEPIPSEAAVPKPMVREATIEVTSPNLPHNVVQMVDFARRQRTAT